MKSSKNKQGGSYIKRKRCIMNKEELIDKIRRLDFEWLSNIEYHDPLYNSPEVLLELAYFYDDVVAKEIPLHLSLTTAFKIMTSPLGMLFKNNPDMMERVSRRRIAKETKRTENFDPIPLLTRGKIIHVDNDPCFKILNIEAIYRKHLKK